MATYLAVFDLNDGSHVYDQFWAKVKTYRSYTNWIEGAWFVVSDKTCSVVADELRALMSAKDELVVVEITGDRWKSYGMNKATNDWLRASVSR